MQLNCNNIRKNPPPISKLAWCLVSLIYSKISRLVETAEEKRVEKKKSLFEEGIPEG